MLGLDRYFRQESSRQEMILVGGDVLVGAAQLPATVLCPRKIKRNYVGVLGEMYREVFRCSRRLEEIKCSRRLYKIPRGCNVQLSAHGGLQNIACDTRRCGCSTEFCTELWLR